MATDPAASSGVVRRTGAYSPSWINWLSAKVERFPGPSWAYYTGLWLILVGIQFALLWLEGADLRHIYHPAQAFLAGAVAFLLGMFQFLDRRAVSALRSIHPLLRTSAEEYAKLEIRMTSLPPIGAIVSFLLALGVVLITEAMGSTYRLDALDAFPVSSAFLRITYYACWGVFGSFIYQTLHRLNVIQMIYSRWTQINLFRRQPLYALSNLTAISAASLTILPIGFLLANRLTDLEQLDMVTIVIVVGIEVIAFTSFLWPQLGIRRMQRDEKDRLLDEVNQRYEKTMLELHNRIDRGELEKSSDLNVTLSILEQERVNVKSIPIWPWDPETLRWLVTALILPLSLMILQMVLQRIFGR